jgi:integrase
VTNKGRAVITIEDNMVRALRHAKRHTNSEYVITSRGEKCDRIVRGFRANMKELGLDDVTPHTLRHTFATWAALKGEPLF